MKISNNNEALFRGQVYASRRTGNPEFKSMLPLHPIPTDRREFLGRYTYFLQFFLSLIGAIYFLYTFDISIIEGNFKSGTGLLSTIFSIISGLISISLLSSLFLWQDVKNELVKELLFRN